MNSSSTPACGRPSSRVSRSSRQPWGGVGSAVARLPLEARYRLLTSDPLYFSGTGVGAAVIFPATLALITNIFTQPAQRVGGDDAVDHAADVDVHDRLPVVQGRVARLADHGDAGEFGIGADEVVIVNIPYTYWAVSQGYQYFYDLSDEDVQQLMQRWEREKRH